jgi:hypothetical protein
MFDLFRRVNMMSNQNPPLICVRTKTLVDYSG